MKRILERQCDRQRARCWLHETRIGRWLYDKEAR